MDLRQLRYFVTVAEELNFSRAAVRLHMSQPPLSHQIKALEEELGVLLLFRNRREVRLTDAGRAFLRDARQLLDQAQAATQRAKLAAQGDGGTLRVGMATSAIDHVMPGFVQRLRSCLPTVQLLVTDMGSQEQVRAVAADKLDLGFVHARTSTRGLARQLLYTEGFALVMPLAHPLAARDALALRDFAEEPMISFSREHRSALFDSLVAACMQAGFSPRLLHVARHPMSMFQMVRHGLGVALVPASYAEVGGEGLRVVELPPSAGTLQIDVVWREDNESELLECVRTEVLANWSVGEPTVRAAAAGPAIVVQSAL
ncbi:LysR substrate-binding domain-containing protein [Variovorax sp. CAN2819]|uniref:LysR substrate-binding domain-containing protein n=1 Tax=Variovorax sp. CAN15 TaxID=3046727 RepID=UPI00264805C9|nr:LysR substrate-binding domain-containing protein [Variovorax sp. CAN15]MDN6882389.1 LysR substrate-binding domain-containing protein [Variovorax sp. CAN15]